VFKKLGKLDANKKEHKQQIVLKTLYDSIRKLNAEYTESMKSSASNALKSNLAT